MPVTESNPRGARRGHRTDLPPRPPPVPKSYPPLPTSRPPSPRIPPDLSREGERFSVERSTFGTPPATNLPPAAGPRTRPASGVLPGGAGALSRIRGGDSLTALRGAAWSGEDPRPWTRFPYLSDRAGSLTRCIRDSDRLCGLVDGGDSRCNLSGRAGRSCAGRSVPRMLSWGRPPLPGRDRSIPCSLRDGTVPDPLFILTPTSLPVVVPRARTASRLSLRTAV